ncbi:MAG: hypothetical protein Q8920_05620 [Bacillota bacterium]|nr:hypothetical protein [Bacillota bacterium]
MKLNAYCFLQYPERVYKINKDRKMNISFNDLTKSLKETVISYYNSYNEIFFICNKEDVKAITNLELSDISFINLPITLQQVMIKRILEHYFKQQGFIKIKSFAYLLPNVQYRKIGDAYINSGFEFRIDMRKNELLFVLSPKFFITKDGINYDNIFARKMSPILITYLSMKYEDYYKRFFELVDLIGHNIQVNLGECGSLAAEVSPDICGYEYKQISEPSVSFGGGRENTFPAAGLKRYSPLDYNESVTGRPQAIDVAFIGSGKCKDTIRELINGNKSYPGFEKIFKSKLKITKDSYVELNENEIISCTTVDEVTALLIKKAVSIRNNGFNMKVCVVELAPQWEPLFIGQDKDLHDAIKVEFWKERIPTQIITQKTQDAYGDSKYDNLGLGIYVSSGGKPWRLAKQFKNSVYIGIAFGQVVEHTKRLVGIAEIFDEYGQSISMKCMNIKNKDLSESFNEDKDYHLSTQLMEHTVYSLLYDYYECHNNNWPQEVIIHKTSSYNNEELQAIGNLKDYPFKIKPVRIYSNGSYLWNIIKSGTIPTRGLYFTIESNKVLLYTSGLIGSQSKYFFPGMPYPLLVEDQSTDYDMEKVSEQIIQLTKLNWNSTNSYEREPVTISHARKIINLLKAGLPENNIPTDIRYFI